MNCVIFLTHNFNKEFINTLNKVDNKTNNNFEIIVLFDSNNNYDTSIEKKFNNIKIIKINRIATSYDRLGHSMYINYFKKNYEDIKKYNYIWIIENDVYYPNSLIDFMNIYNSHNYDLLVTEYGIRSDNWYWLKSLKGFKDINKIGVLAVIMRFSQELLYKLIDNIDINYYGYLEVVLPHICIENGLIIQQFLPEHYGILTTDNNCQLLKLIINDIENGTKIFIEDKLYHPIKI
jgi:hypothetical protein